MINNLDLYGTIDVPRVPKYVCNKRIKLLEERLGVLLTARFTEQNSNLIKRVYDGIAFWTTLRDGEEIV